MRMRGTEAGEGATVSSSTRRNSYQVNKTALFTSGKSPSCNFILLNCRLELKKKEKRKKRGCFDLKRK